MRSSHDLTVCESVYEFEKKLNNHFARKLPLSHKRCGVRRHIEYMNFTVTFDTETTNTETKGFVYSFQMCLDGILVLVRYVEDFIKIMKICLERFSLNSDRRMVIYVHNLGYEHFYLSQIFAHEWGTPETLFTATKKPLTIRYQNGIEFRDSLKLFQKSLAGATKGCAHAKLAGDLDYTKYRTPDTLLTQTEFDYCVNDVQGLWEAIERLKTEHKYNQATIPLTNTGMVKEAVKAEIRRDHKGRCVRAMKELMLNKEELLLAYKAMAGGDTHGTRWRSGEVYEWCNSADLKSAHPSQQILGKFPAGKPEILDDTDIEELSYFQQHDYGWIAKLEIERPVCKPECPDPTISVSKCESIVHLVAVDNGRLLMAHKIIVYMDSNDFWRFQRSYNHENIRVIQAMTFRLEYLPEAFRDAVLKFFRIKESADDGSDRVFAKICVNTIFGACAQKTIRDEYMVDIEDEGIEAKTLHWEESLALKDDNAVYASQKNAFPFLWGLWTSSLSRLALFKLQMSVGWENVIYWDTDSVKYVGKKRPEIEAYNEGVRKQCVAREAVVQNRKGQDVYIGVAEDEHPTVDYGYRKFTFLHAKCYACESYNPKTNEYEIESTIAGVGKKQGVLALAGDIGNLKDGLFISDAGGQCLHYYDAPIKTWKFSRETKTASWIVMTPRQYLVQSAPDKREEQLGEILAE